MIRAVGVALLSGCVAFLTASEVTERSVRAKAAKLDESYGARVTALEKKSEELDDRQRKQFVALYNVRPDPWTGAMMHEYTMQVAEIFPALAAVDVRKIQETYNRLVTGTNIAQALREFGAQLDKAMDEIRRADDDSYTPEPDLQDLWGTPGS